MSLDQKFRKKILVLYYGVVRLLSIITHVLVEMTVNKMCLCIHANLRLSHAVFKYDKSNFPKKLPNSEVILKGVLDAILFFVTQRGTLPYNIKLLSL